MCCYTSFVVCAVFVVCLSCWVFLALLFDVFCVCFFVACGVVFVVTVAVCCFCCVCCVDIVLALC